MATPIRRGPRRVTVSSPRAKTRKATVAKAPIRRGKSVTISSPRAKAKKATIARGTAKRRSVSPPKRDLQHSGTTGYPAGLHTLHKVHKSVKGPGSKQYKKTKGMALGRRFIKPRSKPSRRAN